MSEQDVGTRTWYLVERQYVGPNPDDHLNDGHTLTIQNCPGCTNRSNEEREIGWLGTTGDWSAIALGTIVAANLDAACDLARDKYDLGEWTYREGQARADENDDEPGVESRELPFGDTRFEYRDAADCIQRVGDAEGLTADTTDAELEALALQFTAEAEAETGEDDLPIAVVGMEDRLHWLRDQLRDAR